MTLRPAFFPLLLGLCLGVRPAAAADAFASDWAAGLKSSARLIAGAPTAGVREAGVEIRLAPGAITYWRNPGDAGLPPTLSFEGSDNLAQARISFPAPRRLREGGAEAFGYDGALVLPIDVEPIDAGKPVALALKLNYAVCETICVPAEASLRLALPSPDASPSPFAPAIAAAKALTPRPVEWPALGADLAATGPAAWRLCLAPQAGPRRDLFIEPPEAWWIDVKPESGPAAGAECFRLSLMQKPPDAALPVTARLTVTGGQGPVETVIALTAGAGP
ncbi:MAG: protein-disulfide reductase DsbD domain-containing protein [Roseiarcus sp.]|jgi:DsbC/DsbD-like thiol-disulfide interchange protein